MRLRYLHLSNYPPLTDLHVAFAGNAPWDALLPQDEASRCAIHFVIGLNGSGKSHLLRALAATFVALSDEHLPGFPVTLIYELGTPGEQGHRTLIFDSPGAEHEASLWQAKGWRFPDETERDTFSQAVELLRMSQEPVVRFDNAELHAEIARGSYPQAAPYAIPNAVLAYTSGDPVPWRGVWLPPSDGTGVDMVTQSEDYDPEIERPVGWTQEDEAQIARDDDIEGKSAAQARTPVERPSEALFRRPILLDGVKLTAALLAVTLEDAIRTQQGKEPDARIADLLEKAGWKELIGVRIKLNLDRALAAPRPLVGILHDLLLAAGEVVQEPRSGKRWRSLYFDLRGTLARDDEDGWLNQELVSLTSQGKALHALLGEASDTAFDRFGDLLQWEQHGLLNELELFIRRKEKPSEESLTTLEDIGVLRLSELSDGERMVLARWALFYLLKGQADSLLLLDEPETHFNDAWKRDIVNVVDGALGKDDSTVLIATHSAIVLSDVFDEEIVHIKKREGVSEIAAVRERTFATDPSALMMTVFGADDSIGTRALKRIEAFMREVGQKTDPTPADMQRLQALIHRLGTGFYRSELQTLLNRWRQLPDLRAIEAVIPQLKSDVLKDELSALIQRGQQRSTPTEDGNA
ncbi:MAG: AAA family ATPase [Sideroxydans sp.]|nr:AAA family ATPase [Sideroxydans sp.]